MVFRLPGEKVVSVTPWTIHVRIQRRALHSASDEDNVKRPLNMHLVCHGNTVLFSIQSAELGAVGLLHSLPASLSACLSLP